jgi:hypothetical protein
MAIRRSVVPDHKRAAIECEIFHTGRPHRQQKERFSALGYVMSVDVLVITDTTPPSVDGPRTAVAPGCRVVGTAERPISATDRWGFTRWGAT